MRFSPGFYRGAAVASVVSAVTTLGLIFLPLLYQPTPNLDARMAVGANAAYVLRSWIYLVHPFFVFTAVIAVAARCRQRAAGSASLGLAGFALWAATEAGQQAMTKVVMDRTWRAAWPTADEAAREVIRANVALYDLAWNTMYFLLLLGFLTGSVFLAIAVWHSDKADRLGNWVSVAFLAGGALTLVYLLGELGLPLSLGGDWVYPFIQPAGRTLIGLWLWRRAIESNEATARALLTSPPAPHFLGS